MTENTSGNLLKLLWIICLTNVIALLFLPWLKIISVSWICGSTLSLFNLIAMSRRLKQQVYSTENKARLKGYKDFNIRYLALIVLSVFAVKFLSLNILIFGVGLLSGQIGIFVVYLFKIPGSIEKQE